MTRTYILLTALYLPLACAAHAATEDETTTYAEVDSLAADDFSLGEIVVTGTRIPKLLKDTPVQTRLITRAEIDKSDATDIRDLLQQEMPGVEFSYAMNQQIHLNFGGFGGQGVLFLVDGERLAGETMDDVDFNRLLMSNVERIEIVRGASSALYGSSAGGGVINIITRTADKPWSVNANARIGKHADQRYGVTVTNSSSVFGNSFSASYNHTDNYDVHNAPSPATRVISTVYGQTVWDFRDQITVNPAERLKITGRAGYYFRQLPRTNDAPERYRDYSAGLRAVWQFSDTDDIDIAYSFDQYDKSTLFRRTGLDIRSYSNVQNSVRGVYNHYFGSCGTLSAGADVMRDYLLNDKMEGKHRSEINADAFAQYDWTASEQWEVVGALRYDYFSEGRLSHLTPRISARYKPLYNVNVRLAYGMGFRAPTLKERYYDFDMSGIWTVKGNPALKAETAHNVNLSADYTHGNYNLTASAYFNHVDNKITTGLPYSMPGSSQLYLDYVNLANYNIFGFEATAQAAWSNGLSAKLSYAYTCEHAGRDNSGNTANNSYIPARPHSLTARVQWHRDFSSIYSIDIALNGRFLSAVTNREYADSYNIAAGTADIRYPAYTLWKLSVTQSVTSHVKVTLAIDNLFNYTPKYYYLNAPLTDGISLLAGVNINLN